jgi:hypothetical protein
LSHTSDGGKRAQAVVAGLLDVFASPERVFAGRINDPSRHYPGDIAVRAADDSGWEKVFEVRDKPVAITDVQVFGQKCAKLGIPEVAVVAISSRQQSLDENAIASWALDRGINVRMFMEWRMLVDEIAFWSPYPSLEAASRAVLSIHARLVAIEVPATSVEEWSALVEPFLVLPALAPR